MEAKECIWKANGDKNIWTLERLTKKMEKIIQ
jgi:hypothetical protein